jgi:hypothetical protein
MEAQLIEVKGDAGATWTHPGAMEAQLIEVKADAGAM